MKRPKLNPVDVGNAIKARKFAWIDEQMQKHLEPELYRRCHLDGSGDAQRRVRELGYNIKEEAGGVVLFRKGNDVLSQAQFLLDLDDEGLIQLGKSSKLRIGSA